MADSLKHPLPTCYNAQFGRCRSNHMGVDRGTANVVV